MRIRTSGSRARKQRPSFSRLLVLGMALAVVTAPAAGQAASAEKDPGPAPTGPPYRGPYESGRPAPSVPKGKRAPVEAPASPACTLRASGHASDLDEWASCIQVTTELSRVPAVGETAVLSVEVVAQQPRPDAQVSIELDPIVEFAEPPVGLSVRIGRSADLAVPVPEAVDTIDLAAGAPRRYTVVVRPLKPGPVTLRARATAPSPLGGENVEAGADAVFLTVGLTPAESHFGIDVPELAATERTDATPQPRPVRGEAAEAPLAGEKPGNQASSDAVAGTACVAGSWVFRDNRGVTRPSINFQVQAYDHDHSSVDELLATGVTDSGGNFNLCFENTDEFFEGGTTDPYVLFISENGLWRVRQTGTNDNFRFTNLPSHPHDVPDGTTNFGQLQPLDATLHRGLHAFDAVNSAWFWQGGGCWDVGASPCRQVVVNWAPASTDGTFYNPSANDVHLMADDPNSRIVVQHEVGHAVMDDVYNDAYPPTPNCNPHSIFGTSSQGCAWTEGWAEWYPASIENERLFRFPNGTTTDLEGPTWGDGNPIGGDVEGRVAGALIDISDFGTEMFWDEGGEGDPGPIWTTFQNHVSNTFSEFFLTHRAADGFDVSDAGSRASVYQSTIDYQFRNPLLDYIELTRPTPTPHNYRYNTTTVYYSVVALRPPPGVDYDLALYDDRGHTSFLESSAFGGAAIDFVWVDSNKRAFGDYFPQAFQFSGSGNYQVELAQGAQTVADGSEVFSIGTGDVVTVYDSFLMAGVPTAFRAWASAGMDLELFLLGPNAGDPIGSRGSAAASSSSSGPGGTEQFLHTSSVSDWYGLAILNKGGSGNVRIDRDTSPPTASVIINGGAATTTDPNVTLSLSATDPETGPSFFQASVDGVLDTEPLVPFRTTHGVTLTGGDGVKTVLARFQNGAGMWSATVSDDIRLDTTGPVTAVSFAGNSTDCADKFFGPVNVTLSASDPSGVASTRYRLDGGAFQTYSAPFAVTAKRAHTLEFQSTDSLGNVEGLQSRPFTNGPLVSTARTTSPTKTITVTGDAFFNGELVEVQWDGAALGNVRALDCTFSTTVTVPDSTLGNHTLRAVGFRSSQSATQTVKIKPLVKLSPVKGPAGTSVGFTGYGYRAGETVQVRWATANGTQLATGTANAVGTVGPLTFSVPAAAPGSYNVFGVGATSGANAKAKFRIV